MVRGYRHCFVVFPKYDSYSLKDLQTRQMMSQIYNSWITRVKEALKLPFSGFAEDVFLRTLDVTNDYYYVTGNADFTFITNNMRDYFSRDYVYVGERKLIPSSIIDENVKRIKPPDRRKCFDSEEYKTRRGNTVHQRVRQSCNDYLKTQNLILYFNAKGNSFCNSIKNDLQMGDGIIYIEVDLYSGRADITYSGININESELFTILGGLADGVKND